MNYNLEVNKKGNIDTELYNTLYVVPDNILFNYEHRLSTPKTIYLKSKTRVIEAFEDLLDELERIKYYNWSNIEWKSIDKANTELLDSIMAFTDDGFNILKCFYNKSEEKKETNIVVKWLESVDYKIVKECENRVYKYRKLVGLIDNKIKHEHGRYQHLEMKYSYSRVLGFYIDSVDLDGVVQPNEDIHPKFRGMRTAISYNKELRLLIVNVYFIANEFSRILKKIIKNKYNLELSYKKCDSDDDKRIMNILKKINELDEKFFLDEYSNLPQIIISKDKIEMREQAYASYIGRLIKPDIYKVCTDIILEDKCVVAPPYMDKIK